MLMPAKIYLDGIEQVINDFNSFGFSGRRVPQRYVDLISNSVLKLLKENTPKDSGDLANSWTVLDRGQDYVVLGVPDEQEGLLQAIITGTTAHTITAPEGKSLGPFIGNDGLPHWSKSVYVKGITANNFVEAIDTFIHRLMEEHMNLILSQEHKFFKGFGSGRGNLGKLVGLTGTRYNRRRQFGRTTLIRPRTGRLENRIRIGRRRRVGSISNIKKISLG